MSHCRVTNIALPYPSFSLIQVIDCLLELSSPLFPQSSQRTRVGLQFTKSLCRTLFSLPKRANTGIGTGIPPAWSCWSVSCLPLRIFGHGFTGPGLTTGPLGTPSSLKVLAKKDIILRLFIYFLTAISPTFGSHVPMLSLQQGCCPISISSL